VTALIEALNGGDVGDNVDVVVAPPFLYVDQALSELKSPMQVAAQNAWVEYTLEDETHHYDSDSGAFTGEVRLSRFTRLDRSIGGRDRLIDGPFVRSVGNDRSTTPRGVTSRTAVGLSSRSVLFVDEKAPALRRPSATTRSATSATRPSCSPIKIIHAS
jgi:hypothetical protein